MDTLYIHNNKYTLISVMHSTTNYVGNTNTNNFTFVLK